MDGAKEPSGKAHALRLAVVGPTFFSYLDAIVADFRRRGIDVIAVDEKHSNKLVDKLLYRLGAYNHRLSPRHTYWTGLLDRLRDRGCTDVLLVNVESVDRRIVQKMRAMGMRVHLYMWDGVANKPGFVSYLDLLDGRASFDPIDCGRFGMTYIPLFAEPVFDEERLPRNEQYQYDIGFCGTVHSSRTRIIATLLSASWARHLRLGLLLYYHSKSLLLLKGLVSWSVWKIAPSVSSRSFSKAQIAALFAQCRCILDVPHHGQTGMTARTFEVLLSGTRLLTLNKLTRDYIPESLQSRIVLVERVEDIAALDFESFPPPLPLLPEERYFLSLERFVDQLTSLIGRDEPAQRRYNSSRHD